MSWALSSIDGVAVNLHHIKSISESLLKDVFLCFLSLYLMILSLSLIREFLVGFLLWSNLLQYVWTHLGSSWSSIIHEQVSRSYFDFGSVLEHTPFKLKKIGTLARIFTIVAWNRFLISLGRCVPSFVKFGVSDQKLHHFLFSFFRLFTIHLSDFTVHRSDRYCSPVWPLVLFIRLIFVFLIFYLGGLKEIQYKSSAVLDWLIFIAFIAIGVRFVLNLIWEKKRSCSYSPPL